MSFRSLKFGLTHLAVAACIGGMHEPVSAEFYQWVDPDGRRHVSNIPHCGVYADGTLKELYDPNSIAYQHAQLTSSLRREAVEIERRQALAEAQAAERKAEVAAPRPVRRAVPREGLMNLDELIRLEKRGGRWIGPDVGR